MQAPDIVLLAIVALSGIIGIFRGFLRELVSVVTWVIAIWAAWTFGPDLSPHLGGVLRYEPYGVWAARGIILIALLFIGAAIGLALGYFVRLSIFSGTDRFLGFLFGVGRGIVAIGLVMILMDALQLHSEPWWRGSRLHAPAERVANGLRAIIGEQRVNATREWVG